MTRIIKITVEILLCFILLSAIALGLTHFFFPHIDRYRPYFEKLASETLHQPVSIGHIQASWKGLHPLISIKEIDLLDPVTHEKQLHIQHLQVGTHITASLLHWQFIPSSITLSGAHLLAQRIDTHTLNINGIKIPISENTTTSTGINHIAQWFLNQRTIKLENIDLEWKNEEGQLFQLTKFTAVLRHRSDKQTIHIDQLDLAQISALILAFSPSENTSVISYLPTYTYKKIPFSRFSTWKKTNHSPHTNELWKNYLRNLKPQGILKNIQIHLEIPDTTHIKIEDIIIIADASFTQVQTQAWNQIPSVNGLQGNIHLTPTTGNMQLYSPNSNYSPIQHAPNIQNALPYIPTSETFFHQPAQTDTKKALQLHAPALFPHPLNLKTYQADIAWEKSSKGLRIQSNRFNIADDHLAVDAKLSLWLPQQDISHIYPAFSNPVDIKLFATFSQTDAHYARDYIPVTILNKSPALKNWLTDAFIAGDSVEGQFSLQGPLSHFPFDDHSGHFSATVTAKNMQFNYKTGWPVIHHLNARLLFENRSLTIDSSPGAKILGATTNAAHAYIPDLAHADLEVKGSVNTDMQEGLMFIAQSPLQKTIREGLDPLRLHGNMKLNLGLNIPLHKGDTKTKVKGDVTISPHGTLDIPKWKIKLTELTGALRFTERGLFAHNLTGNWTDQPVKIEIDTRSASAKNEHVIQAHIQLPSTHIQIQSTHNAWLADVNAPNAIGTLNIPRGATTLPIVGNFQYFRIMPGASKTVSDINPGNIPPLNLTFDDFYYGNRSFGNVSLLTVPDKNALQIQRLKVGTTNAHILARGRWQKDATHHQQTTLSGNLRSQDLGATLKAWEITSSIMQGSGRIAFALSWPAAAYDFSTKQLNGSFSLAFEKGSIVNISDEKAAEMGIGRILNLLSLQSIPKRLTLDFSDLLQKGFVFDVMKGDFTMQNGNAVTENSYLNGAIAKIQIKGRIGMTDKDYDLRMITTPYLTASLPIAATLVGGPIAGAATWLGSKVLSGAVDSVTSHTYKITGPWDKPIIETSS